MSVRYAVVIEKAEHNYAAYVPDLDGCVATGQTVEEAEHFGLAILTPDELITQYPIRTIW